MSDQCAFCGKRPIKIKKWQACDPCYQAKRLSGEIVVNKHQKSYSDTMDSAKGNDAQMEFASKHLKPGWRWRPATFTLPGGSRYTPAFWDDTRKSFLQVATTRQGYEQGKDKYVAMGTAYPNVPFVVVTADNVVIDLNQTVSWPEKA